MTEVTIDEKTQKGKSRMDTISNDLNHWALNQKVLTDMIDDSYLLNISVTGKSNGNVM